MVPIVNKGYLWVPEFTIGLCYGAPSRIRTDHLMLTKQLLYLMSYRGILVESIGLEPITYCVQGSRSPR